jgi:hypothetical protein
MKRLATFRRMIYLGMLVALCVSLFAPFTSAQADDKAVSSSIWIPFAVNGKVEPGENNPPPPPPPADEKPWAFFADPKWSTNSASIAIDAKGGIHLAYHYYESVFDGAPTNAVYEYCAGACDKAASWKSLSLGANVNEIQLELTAEGHPRLLYRVPTDENGQAFYYAECNQNCTQASSWKGAAVASNRGTSILEFSDDEQPQRYFELDPQGHPRFVYVDYDSFKEPDHVGTYYTYCDSGCTAASNWSEVRITKNNNGVGPYRSEDFYYPALAFTPSGQPRILADGTSMDDQSALYYVSCDSKCGEMANWHSTPLFERGSGNNVAYDIEINAQGQPRIAYFDGARLNGEGEWLYYGWCNQACTTASNWQRYDFNFAAKEGQEPDLVLDAAGKPHIAYALYSDGGLGYSFCDSDCESANGHWTNQVVESRANLAQVWDVAYPPHCDGGVWDGLTPTLALDKSGNALFAYDATYYARCYYNDVIKVWEEYFQFHLVQRTVRTYFLPKE